MYAIFKVTCVAVALIVARPLLAQEPPSRGSVRGGPTVLGMLRHKAVQEELKVSDKQQEQLKAVMMKMRDKMIAHIENGEREKAAAIVKEHQKDLLNILTAEQAKRLKEVTLQVHGLWAMTVPETAAELKITEEQKTKLRNLQAETEKQMNKLFSGKEASTRTEVQKKMGELHQAATEKGLEVLTAEQRMAWRTMVGQPFTGEIPRVPPMGLGGSPKKS
jgi:Spy/CpxP family protein refolding chaperone